MTAFIKNNVVEIFEKKITQEVVKKILIKDLIVEKIFGYYPEEKIKTQKLKFNIKLELNQKLAFDDHNLKSIVDYDDIIRLINSILDRKINFLEILGELIAEEILKNEKIEAIELQIEKLDILKTGGSVGFEINKRKK
jgi:FolB domain-containing protein|tara:strand:+ start:381 stop:794 length:414 start_codon:yes stop_codon:yes gene_type:complete